ncbi:hypothetical protein AALA61_15745 [Oscillospiraceae bacterium 42-9]
MANDKQENVIQQLKGESAHKETNWQRDERNEAKACLLNLLMDMHDCHDLLKKYESLRADLVKRLVNLQEISLEYSDVNLTPDEKQRLSKMRSWIYHSIKRLTRHYFEDDNVAYIMLKSIWRLELTDCF